MTQVDFHFIEEKQIKIHERLLNWSRWCAERPGQSTSPMFRLYRPDEHWEGQSPTIPIDKIDAQRIAKGVSALPENHRHSLSWYYIWPCSPKAAARSMGTTVQGLARYVYDSRLMLINRGV